MLDAILERYMENDQSIEQIIAAGFAAADVERVTRLIKINEYKRRQSPVGIRVTHRSFGKDWRYPITNRFRASLVTDSACVYPLTRQKKSHETNYRHHQAFQVGRSS